MLAAVPKVRPDDAPTWVHYLNGLGLSGLSLEESTVLSWGEDAPIMVYLSDRRPRLATKTFGIFEEPAAIWIREVVRPKDAAAWEYYLKGLWFSGLRLGGALVVSWDEDAPISIV